MGKGIFNTPFRDWGVVNFIQDKAPHLMKEVVGGLADVALGESPVRVVADRIRGEVENDGSLSEHEKKEILERLDFDLERARVAAKDRADARDAEMMRLKSDSHLIKHFTYYLAMTLLVGALGLVVMMFFFEIPEENMQMINIAFGVLFTTGVAGMFQYFFGDVEKNKNPRL